MMFSDYDLDHFDDILHGHGDWFAAHLIRLMAKADPTNLMKLWFAFPQEVTLFRRWRETGQVRGGSSDYLRGADLHGQPLPHDEMGG